MAGTVKGAKQSAATIIAQYGPDFYSRIGKIGGAKSRGGGFVTGGELAKRAGRLGGVKSRRYGPHADDCLCGVHRRVNAAN